MDLLELPSGALECIAASCGAERGPLALTCKALFGAVRRSRRAVRLVALQDSSCLEALRQKLHWRGTYF